MSWTEKQERAFIEMLMALGEVFNEPVSVVRGEMFMRLVEDLLFAPVMAAAVQLGRRATFFPKPGEIRALVEGKVEDQAELAWTHLLCEVARVGYIGTPTWPDETTQRAAEGLFGSWRALCERLPAGGPELLGFRKQFLALYGATARKAIAGELGPGRAEARGVLEGLQGELKKRGLPYEGALRVVPKVPKP